VTPTFLLVEAVAPQPSWAGVLGAFASVLTAVALIIGGMATYRKAGRVEKKVDHASEQIGEVHVIVNQRFTDLENYVQALIRRLEVAGIDVPEDQSKGGQPR
jgi:hypothetical protein